LQKDVRFLGFLVYVFPKFLYRIDVGMNIPYAMLELTKRSKGVDSEGAVTQALATTLGMMP
jgi:hypothetical protein